MNMNHNRGSQPTNFGMFNHATPLQQHVTPAAKQRETTRILTFQKYIFSLKVELWTGAGQIATTLRENTAERYMHENK